MAGESPSCVSRTTRGPGNCAATDVPTRAADGPKPRDLGGDRPIVRVAPVEEGAALEMTEGLAFAPQAGEGDRQVLLGGSVIRLDLQGRFIRLSGALHLAHLE